MPITTAHSTNPLAEAAQDLRAQCGDPRPRLVLFFASTKYEPHALSQQLQAAFPGACVAGCSTAGEITSGKMMTGAVVAMFFPADVVEEAAAVVVENLRSEMRVKEAFAEFERHFQSPLSSLDLTRHVGLVLVDGLSGAEERLMEKIGDCSDILFVGGAAGDDLKFWKTWVCVGGKAYPDAALLVLLRLKNGFEILKTQSFLGTGQYLIATEVDEAHRKVVQFDCRPAVHAYADAIGVPAQEVSTHFMRRPMALMVNGEPFVRSPQRVEGQSIVFYCQIKQGMQLEVLTSTDIVADTRAALAERKSAMGRIAGLIDFHCILRTLELRNEKRCDEYGAIFSDLPAIGFSTYGEEYLGHMNQTSTMILFR
ncbi:MAG TPA: FIST N-terminal domain-containing protein [Terriglobales bacterium]|nr:FIST N-terminal domain-containing protein [Terriglobales bacterium]